MNNMSYMNHGGGDGGARGPPPPPPPQQQQMSLETKVQEMASTLRGECDKALRAKMLAVERYHLKRDEVNAASDSLRALQEKLGELQDGMQVLHETSELQRHVDDLKKQVAFQHEELVTLTDKFVGEQTTFGHEEQQRHRIRSNLQGVVLQQRQSAAVRHNNENEEPLPPPPEFTARTLKMALIDLRDELEDDRAIEDERWRSGLWSQLTLDKARDHHEAALECRHESEWIRQLLLEYRHHMPQLGLEDIDEDDNGFDDDFDTHEATATATATAAPNDYDMEADDVHGSTTHEGGVNQDGTFGGGGGGGGYGAYGADQTHEGFVATDDPMAGTFPAYHKNAPHHHHHHYHDDGFNRGGRQHDPNREQEAGDDVDSEGEDYYDEADDYNMSDPHGNLQHETRHDITGQQPDGFDSHHESGDYGPLPEATATDNNSDTAYP